MDRPAWAELIESLEKIETDLRAAQSDDDFRAIGTKCRETVISLAQLVYSPEEHLPAGQTTPGSTDSKEMLGHFLEATLANSSATDARAFVRVLLKLSNSVVHRRPSNPRDAKLAVLGLRSLIELISILADQHLQNEPWIGVRVGSRFFAWKGPTLHALEDRQPIPAPEEAVEAIKKAGHRPSYGLKARLRHHLAQGLHQVYDTDKRTWRRELLYDLDGNQVLLIKERAD